MTASKPITLALTAALLMGAPARTQETPPLQTVFSRVFYGDSSGQYISADCTKFFTAQGMPSYPLQIPIVVNPWEPVSINIVKTEIVIVPNGIQPKTPNGHPSILWGWAGNNVSPDEMGWFLSDSRGAAHSVWTAPAGTAMPFPAASPGAAPPGPGENSCSNPAHLDLHVNAPKAGGFGYQAFLTIYYTKNAQ